MIGPEVAGCRPVIMTFRLFRDRDEVFRKAGMLRGSGLHVSEDVTRLGDRMYRVCNLYNTDQESKRFSYRVEEVPA